MAGVGRVLRGSEKDEDETIESFIIKSDDENDPSFFLSSEDEEFMACNCETRNSAVHRVMDPSDGRVTPDIHQAIRRSLHRLSTESFDVEKGRNSGDGLIPDSENESDDDVQIVQNNRRRRRPVNLESSDEEPAAAKNLESSYGGPVVPKNRVEAEVTSKNRAEKEDSPENSGEEEHSAKNSVEEELAMSIGMKDTRNSSLDPLKAQKKACLVHQKQQLEKKLTINKMVYYRKMDLLPDLREKLRLSILKDEKELETITDVLRNRELEAVSNAKTPKAEVVKKTLFKEGSLEIDPQTLKPTALGIEKHLGKQAQATVERELGLSEDQQAKVPRGLKVNLMPHQKYALTWLLWRETQNPSGGILADDMGLGKTLTMISLLLAAKAAKESEEAKWLSSARTQRHLGGTLVMAPASLIAQWESEVKNRCKRGLLSAELFHGGNRERNPKHLARNDMVKTTYKILTGEFKASGILYKIRWRRVILDEAHVIRNHKSQTCESACGLHADKRWLLTGIPVQNKEMYLFSILKFLRCSPYDDMRVWKRWVDDENAAGPERLVTVMKSIMLRRTKQELQANGPSTLCLKKRSKRSRSSSIPRNVWCTTRSWSTHVPFLRNSWLRKPRKLTFLSWAPGHTTNTRIHNLRKLGRSFCRCTRASSPTRFSCSCCACDNFAVIRRLYIRCSIRRTSSKTVWKTSTIRHA